MVSGLLWRKYERGIGSTRWISRHSLLSRYGNVKCYQLHVSPNLKCPLYCEYRVHGQIFGIQCNFHLSQGRIQKAFNYTTGLLSFFHHYSWVLIFSRPLLWIPLLDFNVKGSVFSLYRPHSNDNHFLSSIYVIIPDSTYLTHHCHTHAFFKQDGQCLLYFQVLASDFSP